MCLRYPTSYFWSNLGHVQVWSHSSSGFLRLSACSFPQHAEDPTTNEMFPPPLGTHLTKSRQRKLQISETVRYGRRSQSELGAWFLAIVWRICRIYICGSSNNTVFTAFAQGIRLNTPSRRMLWQRKLRIFYIIGNIHPYSLLYNTKSKLYCSELR